MLGSSAHLQPRSPPRTRSSGCSSSSAAGCVGGTGCASVYLLDVLQQVRHANSICRQLRLSTQYRLAQGSSRKDRWQLEQIAIELWELTGDNSSTQGRQLQQQGWESGPMGGPGSADGQAAGAAGQWQLRKRLSLPQFTVHISRLKGCAAAPAASRSGGHGTTAGGGAAAWRPSADALPGGQRAASAAAGCQRGNRGGRVHSSSSTSVCQLLVLSPRSSSSGDPRHCLLRPASPPRGGSRLSPRRR